MKWKNRRQSSNIEDRRGQQNPKQGLGKLNPLLIGQLIKILFSKTGVIIIGVFLAFSFLTGNNPLSIINSFFSGDFSSSQTSASYKSTKTEDEMVEFSSTILADTEDVWNKLLNNYREPTLVLFTNSVNSACGNTSSASGPFYCPGDEKLYLDLSFFDEMATKLNAPGDFAQAYVIAHEVGHHIQKIMGTTNKINKLRGKISQTEFNKYSVRLELQADFLAGVWAHHSEKMSKMMETGDLNEALNAANAIGDDRLQKSATGRVVPDSFTHGTSEQRMRWFKKGFDTGDLSNGDTFGTNSL
jgi:predicted metalloprotease